jgi:hypothetical protein
MQTHVPPGPSSTGHRGASSRRRLLSARVADRPGWHRRGPELLGAQGWRTVIPLFARCVGFLVGVMVMEGLDDLVSPMRDVVARPDLRALGRRLVRPHHRPIVPLGRPERGPTSPVGW